MFKVSRIQAPTLDARVDEMDIDDLGEGPSQRSVVTPGEVITNAKEYMRLVFPASPSFHLLSPRLPPSTAFLEAS